MTEIAERDLIIEQNNNSTMRPRGYVHSMCVYILHYSPIEKHLYFLLFVVFISPIGNNELEIIHILCEYNTPFYQIK